MASSLFVVAIACGVASSGAVAFPGWPGDSSLLVPLSTEAPDEVLHPPRDHTGMEPYNIDKSITHPLQTNKFWGNWIVKPTGMVGDGVENRMSIYPVPFTLQWRPVGDCESGELIISHPRSPFYQGGDPITLYLNHFNVEFVIGAVEELTGRHTVTEEGHFGIHVKVEGEKEGSIVYPVFAGMAYVSALFADITPRVANNDHGIKSIDKIRAGVWRFLNGRNEAFRVYVMDRDGNYVDDSYDFDSDGNLNQKLSGWVRLAHELEESDRDVLDQHADAILVDWDLEVEENLVQYKFSTISPKGTKLLHFAYANHMEFLTDGAVVAPLTRSMSPVKGKMTPLIGDIWNMRPDISRAMGLSFLPALDPTEEDSEVIKGELMKSYEHYKLNWRKELFRKDHYFTGKAHQKLGMICLMARKYYGRSAAITRDCTSMLRTAFKCNYERLSDDADRATETSKCWWSPPGTYYDKSWGGLPSVWADEPICGVDFGNSCYNDHHYHFGYYVVAGAILLELDPHMSKDSGFTNFVDALLRDTSTPSSTDSYFPQFRSFDWFDMHSWSRGLRRNPDGKDQESTSEEVNLHYGAMLWGRGRDNSKLEKLGATMLTVASVALQQYFLMMNDNKNHNPLFAKNHVTGIFFQNKVHLTTWFGPKTEYIHGIQMLPLTPAVPLARTPEFAREEWEDTLADLPMSPTDRWSSILLTGGLGIYRPREAWKKLMLMEPSDMDDGLTKAWGLYWIASQPDPHFPTTTTVSGQTTTAGSTTSDAVR